MRYLISGYYGDKNAGDEAILAGILQEIERRDPEARFVVLSFDPDDTEARHGEARELVAIPTSLRSPRLLRTVMKGADLLISGGGSFLHEADFALHGRSFLFRQGKLRPIPYFLTVVLLARSQGVPVMWYAQGLGPLHTWAARRLVAVAGSVSQAVCWRDRDSAVLARAVGVRGPVQLVVPDPAYALDPAPAGQARAHLAACGVSLEQPYIAVCPRPWLGWTGFLEGLAWALEESARVLDLQVVFVPFHEVQDLPICEDLAARLRARPGLAGPRAIPPVPSPSLLSAVLGQARLTVAMRLHSGILSTVAGTPTVVLDYDPKTMAFAHQTRQSAWRVSVDELEREAKSSPASSSAGGLTQEGLTAQSARERLLEAIVATVRDLPARRALVQRAVSGLKAEAGGTAALAVQLAAARRAGGG